MKYEDLEEYFKSYVTTYNPYKDDKLYKGIVKFLHTYYLKHTYEAMPSAFKTAFETQVIPSEFYDVLLLSNGFPKTLLETLTFNDKFILLNTLMDYNVYKGTLKCLRKVVSVFDDNFNVYELFLDYQDIGEGEYDWVFLSYPVYVDPDLKDHVIEAQFRFEEIYHKAEHFFINKPQLEELRQRNEVVLPIKTNLILLDQTTVHSAFPLLSLFFTIALSAFRNERLVLYFTDGEYSTTVERTYKLWYYIIYKWYGKDIEFTAPALVTMFSIDSPNFNYELSDIDTILQEYEDIRIDQADSGEQVRVFYKDRIEDIFRQFQQTPIQYSQEEWTQIFKDQLGDDLVEYVDKRLTDFEAGSNITKEANKLLDEVYNSLVTWSVTSDNPDVNNYVHYFLDLLPMITIKPEDTGTFKVLNFMKPFHVELTGQGRSIFKVNDKFNSVLIDNKFNFIFEMTKATLNNVSYQLLPKLIHPEYDTNAILHDFYFMFNYYIEMMAPILDEYNFVTTMPQATVREFSSDYTQELTLPLWTFDLENIYGTHTFETTMPLEQDYGREIIHNTSDITTIFPESMAHQADDFVYDLTLPTTDNVHIDDYISQIYTYFEQQFMDLKEKILLTLTSVKYSIQTSSHNYSARLNQLKKYSQLYSFVSANLITKLYKDTEVHQEIRKLLSEYLRSKTVNKIDGSYLPTTEMSPKLDNVNVISEGDLTQKQPGESLLEGEIIYNFDGFIPIETLQDMIHFIPSTIIPDASFDNLHIDSSSSTTDIRTEEELLNILFEYTFEYDITKMMVSSISERFSSTILPGPSYDTLGIIVGFDRFSSGQFDWFDAAYTYRFDTVAPKETFPEFLHEVPFTSIIDAEEEIQSASVDFNLGSGFDIPINMEYMYEFDENWVFETVAEINDWFNYFFINIIGNTFQLNIFAVPIHVDFDTIEIEHMYDIDTDWVFLTPFEIEYEFPFYFNLPDRESELFIDNSVAYGIRSETIIKIDHVYDYYNASVTHQFLLPQLYEYEYSFSQDFITSHVNEISDLPITGLRAEVPVDTDFNWIFEYYADIRMDYDLEHQFGITQQESHYITSDQVHLYLPIPKQYGETLYNYINHFVPFTTIYPTWMVPFEVFTEYFFETIQRKQYDGIIIQTEGRPINQFIDYLPIDDMYKFLPYHYIRYLEMEFIEDVSFIFRPASFEEVLELDDHFDQFIYQIDFNELNFIYNYDLTESHVFNSVFSNLEFYNYITTLKDRESETEIKDNYWLIINLPETLEFIMGHDNFNQFNVRGGSIFNSENYLEYTISPPYDDNFVELKYFKLYRTGFFVDYVIEHDKGFDGNFVFNSNYDVNYHWDYAWWRLENVGWREEHSFPVQLIMDYQIEDLVEDYNWLTWMEFDPEEFIAYRVEISDEIYDIFSDVGKIIAGFYQQDALPIEHKYEKGDFTYPNRMEYDLEYPFSFYIEDVSKIDHFRMVSFGSPVLIQYGKEELDFYHGFNFVNTFRYGYTYFNVDYEYRFNTRLYPNTEFIQPEVFGTPIHESRDELSIGTDGFIFPSPFSPEEMFIVESEWIVTTDPPDASTNVDIQVEITPMDDRYLDFFKEIESQFVFNEYFYGNHEYNIEHNMPGKFRFEEIQDFNLTLIEHQITEQYTDPELINIGYVYDNKELTIFELNDYIIIEEPFFKIESTEELDINTSSDYYFNPIVYSNEIQDTTYDYFFEKTFPFVDEHYLIENRLHQIYRNKYYDSEIVEATDDNLIVRQLQEEIMDFEQPEQMFSYAPEVVSTLYTADSDPNFIISPNVDFLPEEILIDPNLVVTNGTGSDSMDISHDFNTIKL